MGSTSEVPPTRAVTPGVIARLSPPATVSGRRRVGRPSKSDSFDPWVDELLARDPAVSTRDLLASARRAGYEGGKTAFYALVARARERRASAGTAVAPGEISQHDVGETDVTYASGDRRRLRFFVSRLVYSGWLVASLVDEHETEPVARALVDHFAVMGGVPLLARFEHPRPVADAWLPTGEVAAWNLTFAYLAAQLGIGIEVRRPRGLGRRVKEGFFRGRVFRDRVEAAEGLAAWCREIDLHTPSDAQPGTGATPATLLALEQRRLRPLGVAP
ncbi:MAG: hypothetical protein JOZ69_21205, partial [Myxococcales bacterium]|nr:hypothetical protein [Myxococcales bacterium]